MGYRDYEGGVEKYNNSLENYWEEKHQFQYGVWSKENTIEHLSLKKQNIIVKPPISILHDGLGDIKIEGAFSNKTHGIAKVKDIFYLTELHSSCIQYFIDNPNYIKIDNGDDNKVEDYVYVLKLILRRRHISYLFNKYYDNYYKISENKQLDLYKSLGITVIDKRTTT